MKVPRKWWMAILSLIYSGHKQQMGPIPDNAIIGVLTQYHVKNSYRHRFLEALSEYAFSSLKTAGNIMAEAYYERGDLCIMWIIERWSSQAYYKDNKGSGAAKVVHALTKVGLASPVEITFIKDLELLSRESRGQLPGDNHRSLTIMLFIDLKEGTEDDFKLVNQVLLSAFRNDPGTLIFRLSQVANDKTRFVVYKKFRDREAFQHHLQDPAVEPVMRFLQTAVKEPPFERGYHHLVEFPPLHGDL